MKYSNLSNSGSIIILVLIFFASNLFAQSSPVSHSDTTVIHAASTAPVFDGMGDDLCWEAASWQPIDYVWIPYGAFIPADDYSGRFKILWSKENSLLYFLVEVHDDVFVDGFDPGMPEPEVFNFDIIEIFIDPDHSGGRHVFDGTGETAKAWGSNAENAFAHHIYAVFPDSNQIATSCFSGDMTGTDWNHVQHMNYTGHFENFALHRDGHRAVWELSLKVYDDMYINENPEASRIQLASGMVMGISLAYCDNDNDDEAPVRRDHFFGSVYVEKEAYNDHWMNADDFGIMVLGR